MITYTIKESNEDIKKAVIEKTGHTAEFTLSLVEENEASILKTLKELGGVIDNRKAIMTNIEEHHDFVKELTEEQRNTVLMHRTAEMELQQYETKRDEVQKILDDSKVEVQEIKKQLNINE